MTEQPDYLWGDGARRVFSPGEMECCERCVALAKQYPDRPMNDLAIVHFLLHRLGVSGD